MVKQPMYWLLALMCWCGSQMAYAQSVKKLWRLYSEANTTLTLYYGEAAPAEIGGQPVTLSQVYDSNEAPAAMQAATVAVVDATVERDYTPTSLHKLFSTLSSLERIEGQDLLRPLITRVKDISYMFYGCNKLTSIDVSGWNTANVEKMEHLFTNCQALTTLAVAGWDVSKAKSMQSVFQGCNKLTSLDLSAWRPVEATSMHRMFLGCEGLTTLNVSGWNTAKVTTMEDMFRNCVNVQALDFTGWNTAKVTSMKNMFRRCRSLIALDMKQFSGASLAAEDSIFDMFNQTLSLQYVDWRQATNFTVEQLQQMHLEGGTPFTLYYAPIGLSGVEDGRSNIITTADGVTYTCRKYYVLDEAKVYNFLLGDDAKYYRPQYVINIPQAFTADLVINMRLDPFATQAGEAYTWYMPYDAPMPEGVKAYEFVSNSVSGTTATFRRTADVRLQAQKPYIVVPADGPILAGVEGPCEVPAYTPGADAIVAGDGWDFVGTFKRRSAAEAAAEGLYTLESGSLWKAYEGATTPPSSIRAYLKNKSTGAATTLSLVLDDSITGIYSAPAEGAKTDVVGIYDLSGRYVGNDKTQLSKGVYIVDGHKVAIR